jgi:hypothetical protein
MESAMNMRFAVEDAAVRRQAGYISPERLATLKMIFEAVCAEAAIPSDAKGERNALATRLLAAGETIDSEMMLVVTAMKAVADYRLAPPTSVP